MSGGTHQAQVWQSETRCIKQSFIFQQYRATILYLINNQDFLSGLTLISNYWRPPPVVKLWKPAGAYQKIKAFAVNEYHTWHLPPEHEKLNNALTRGQCKLWTLIPRYKCKRVNTTKSNRPRFRVHHEPFPGQMGSLTMSVLIKLFACYLL